MDIIRDSSWNTLLQISDTLDNQLPKYVKQYTPLTEKNASDLNDNSFADNFRRMFPINSPAATWTSAMYLNYNKDDLNYKQAEFDYVADRIMKAAKIFGIKRDVDKALAKMAEKIKPVKLEVVKSEEEFPIYDAEGVKRASAYFEEHHTKYPADWRKDIAFKIIKKAEEYQVPLNQLADTVFIEAEYGLPDMSKLAEDIAYRVRQAPGTGAAVLLDNVNNILANVLPNSAVLSKVAGVISDFDEAIGLTAQYNKTILPPAHTVFRVSIKSAGDGINDAVQLRRHVFSAEKLASVLDLHDLAGLLGDQVVACIVTDDQIIPQKLAATFNQLPAPEKATLENYIASTFSE